MQVCGASWTVQRVQRVGKTGRAPLGLHQPLLLFVVLIVFQLHVRLVLKIDHKCAAILVVASVISECTMYGEDGK